jgi:HNH endonuclease
MGGPLKIDSVQNLITLRSDLHSAWHNYEFGVDPDESSI